MPYHQDEQQEPSNVTKEAKDELLGDFVSRLLWVLIPVLIGGVVSMFSNVQQDVQIIIWGVMFLVVAFGLWIHQAKIIRKRRERVEHERWEHLENGLDTRFDNIDRRFDEIDLRFDESDKTDRTLLRNELVRAHRDWVEDKGYITLEGLEYVDETYEEYHAKGGNGSGTRLWEDIHKLPIREYRQRGEQ